MKKYLSFLFLLVFAFDSYSQVALNVEPLSDRATFIERATLENLRLLPPDASLIYAEDVLAEEAGKPPRYAVHIPVNSNMTNSGSWIELKGGARIWRLRLESPGALATTIMYDEFSLPEGARLHIYNDDKSSVIGAFTSFNNQDGGTFATQLVMGEACTIEYYEPSNVRGLGHIQIAQLGHCYRNVFPPNYEEDSRGGSQFCEVDVNCSEGNNWQDEKHGVLGMSIATNFGSSWCTASLVNNTSLDCKNYILSAMHCTENSNNGNFGQYVFYFNYESTGCGSGNVNQNQSVTGCTLRADSDDNGGGSGSDFALMEHLGSIPSSYDPYYNGWNAQNVASGSGVGIHHPAGDRKKISTYTSQLTTGGWGINNTHWNVNWESTTNGHGVTEGGSSGSPLFDIQGRIVGTLTGGGSYCSDIPNPSDDQYGKMSYHWTSNPGDDLRDWLDAANTGQLTLSGTYAPCTPPTQNDAGISAVSSPNGSICANSINPIVTLSNYAGSTLSTVNIHYNVDGTGTQVYQWSGTLGTNQSVTVALPSVTVGAGAHTFNAYTSQPNNQNDENGTNDSSSSSFTITIADTYVSFVLNMDDYGEETTWQLAQDGGGVVASGGPYNNFENIQIQQDLCVATGQCYTFTIYDSFGDGICCYTGTQNPNYADGNYSLGNADGISIHTGSEFGTEEVVNFCVPASSGACDTLFNPFFSNANGYYVYPNPDGGYISGSNNYGDLAKAQAFNAPVQPVEVSGVVFWIAVKQDDGASITANLHSLDGNGTDVNGPTTSAPGSVLSSASKGLNRIDTSGFFNLIEFTNPVTVSSAYAIGLDFSAFGNNDGIGIVTNTDGDANGSDMAWEQWSDDEWHSMNQAWNNASDGDFDLAIFPIICPQNVTDVTDLSDFFNVFPNPNNGEFAIVNSAGFEGELSVFNAVGQSVLHSNLSGQTVINCDLSNSKPGMYLIRVTTESGLWTSRVVLK